MFFYRQEIVPGWMVAFTDIDAGNLSFSVSSQSDAQEHRRRLVEATGVALPFQFMSQVHGTQIVQIEAPQETPEADGLISPGVPLAVMVADCLPVIFYAETDHGGLAAAVHAGRRGLAAGILLEAVQQLRERSGCNLQAVIGPAICGRCYEVPESMQAEIAQVIPETYSTTRWGSSGLDLAAGAQAQLEKLQVKVTRVSACTLEEPRLFSHRASSMGRRDEGRFAGLIYPGHHDENKSHDT